MSSALRWIYGLVAQNMLSFALLGGFLVVRFANRDSRTPALGTLRWIIAAAVGFIIAKYAGNWAADQGMAYNNLRYAMSVCEYTLTPVIVLLELLAIVKPPRHKRILAIPALINAAVSISAPWTHGLMFSFNDTGHFQRGPLSALPYATAFLYLLLLLIMTLRSFREGGRKKGIIVVYMFVITMGAACLEYMDAAPGVLDTVIFVDIFLYYTFLSSVLEVDIKNQLVQRELELSRSRVRLMQEQIQPHFIFNSLYVIKALIRRDPEQAVESVEDFSAYLRSNLDALRSEKLIPFRKELEHIEAYVALERADETRQIELRYDLEAEDFYLPALSVEPIVENAFRHGLGARAEGGRVELITRREADAVRILVRDNGAGFEATTARWQKNSSVGTRNVRTRLEEQCGGTLTLESGPAGTTAEIRIPIAAAEGKNAAGKEAEQ